MKSQVIYPRQANHPWLRNFSEIETLSPTTWLGDFDKNYSSINILEETDRFCVDVYVPGFTREDFKITIEQNVITITADKQQQNFLKQTSALLRDKEYQYNSFSRSFRLPENIKQDFITAVYKDDVLKLTIPKSNSSEKKEIQVQ